MVGSLARALAALLLLALPAAGQANDTYLPRSPAAEEALARGDAAWIAAGEDAAARRQALDAWHEALVASAPGDAVRLDLRSLAAEPIEAPWALPRHEAARRSEAVEVAVMRRLVAAGDATRAEWRARFGELATTRAGARNASALERAERDHPGTFGAAVAALRLAERSLEEGRTLAARTWLDRAAGHRELGAGGDDLRDAIARRRESFQRVAPTFAGARDTGAARSSPAGAFPANTGVAHTAAEALRGARGLELRAHILLRFVDGGRPGSARLADGHLLVQGRGGDRGLDMVWEVDRSGIARPFEPWKMLDAEGLLYAENRRGPGDDWNFAPRALGDSVLFVLGRAEDLRGYDERSNTVARLVPPKGARAGKLEWAIGPSGLWNEANGLVAPLEDLLGPGLWEFQPEPLVLEDRVVLQARAWNQERDEQGRLRLAARGEARAVALALDLTSGRPLWVRELGRGAEPRARVDIPIAATRRIRTPASAPVRVGATRVFCGTQLGLGALLDVADGRVIWSYKNPRREADDPGWDAVPPPRVTPGADGAPPVIAWAPADGDRLSWVRGDADLAGEGLAAHPPLARDEALALLGADARGTLILARYGPLFTLASYRPDTGERRDAIDLGRGETPLTDLLVSPDRALFASDRALYLFDRERELYLLEALPLPVTGGPSTGRLSVHEGKVELLVPNGVLIYAVLR